MLLGILRFNKRALADIDAGAIGDLSLGEYLDHIKVSDFTKNRYIIPMGAAIWSTPADEMLNFPAISFVQFFKNHKLLHTNKPVWRTVTGGSRSYVEKLTASFQENIKLSSEAVRVTRHKDFVEVLDANSNVSRFDEVIFACHSDQALKALADPTKAEQQILGAIRYRPNQVYLHRDPSLMPKRKKVWASWNYLSYSNKKTPDVVLSYWMNRLQNIAYEKPLFVTLNPIMPPKPELTYGQFEYDHPQYDAPALKAQQNIKSIQGDNRTWYCGAYHGYGFHEDGATSGARVAIALGASLPWGGTLDGVPTRKPR
jgi:predicted NAD/FAD-binding protein